MDVLKTIVGKHINNMFLENVALNVSGFLGNQPRELTEAENDAREMRSMFQDALENRRLDGETTPFPKYTNNLSFDDEGVYSYGAKVVEIEWFRGTLKRIGIGSRTTSKHQTYAIETLKADWGFREI